MVHPITAALAPQVGDPTVILDEGLVFIRGDSAPLLVLPFVTQADLELGITGMRLSTSPDFNDGSGAAVPFEAHSATASVALPAADGSVDIFAQFEARAADNAFVFVSPTVKITVIKDTTAPDIVEATALGLRVTDGVVLSPSRTIAVRVDAADQTSGIDAVGVGLGDVPDALTDVTASPGLQRVQQQVTAEADGEDELVVIVDDRAGNRSTALRLPVLVDTVAPAVSMVVQGAEGGVLRGRVATVVVSSDVAGDDDLLVAVGLEGAVNDNAAGPLGEQFVLLPESLQHNAAVTFEAIVTDVVGNVTTVTQTVTLDLRGSVAGVVVSDAVPAVVSSVAGASVSLIDARGASVTTPIVVGADGAFTVPAVPEGRGYRATVSLAGHVSAEVRNIAVVADEAVDLGEVPVALARGEVRGEARRADVEADNATHAGIAVSARLISTSRSFSDTVITDATGAFAFRAVPRTLAGESLALSAQADDYGAATDSVILEGGLVEVQRLLLPRARGDFDVCRSADPTCAPAQFFSADTIDVRLRDAADVVAVLVGINGDAAERLPLGADNRTSVTVDGFDDGELILSVQAEKSDGSRSEVLSATVVRDTVPPSDVEVVRRAAPAARDPRFTNQGFVDVFVSADDGAGGGAVVAPLAQARVVVADAAPALPTAGFVGCTHEASCRVTLPNQERLLRVFAFSCDAAGNCADPEETFVIRDVTPPSQQNGASFAVAANRSIVVDGDLTILPSPLYNGVINTGVARTVDNIAVTDEAGAGVADVFAFRFSLSAATLQNATLQSFSDFPTPDDERSGADIVVPALPAGELEQTVFAAFVDAAGNASQELLRARVQVDVSGPVVVVVINGGAPTSANSVPFTATVPPGAEAPTRVALSVDDGIAQVFTLPLDPGARLALPATEGNRRVVVNAFDRVDNVTRRS